MKAAIVAIEDRRFYQHQGVDWQGTIRAVVANSASGDVVQGASTLTQQYVKNYLLYVEAQTEAERLKATEQTPARKLREARIALQMERSLSQGGDPRPLPEHRVLGQRRRTGSSAAARTYFNTTADQLTVAQAALLAGMVRSTTQFDPVANPQAALERRNVVISQMQRAGDDRRGAGAAGVGAAAGHRQPAGHPARTGASGRGMPGSSASTSPTTWPRPGSPMTQITRGGYTIKTTLDRERDGEDEGVAERRRCPPDAAERGRRDGDRGAGPGPAPGVGDGLQPRRSGSTPASRRPATGCPTSRSTWAPGRCTRSSPRPRRWRRGWASTTR